MREVNNSFISFSKGVTRVVFLIGNYAIKIPSFENGLEYFVLGWYSNIRERRYWNYSKHRKIMPVYFSLLGLINVCKRYRTMVTTSIAKEEIKEFPFLDIDNNGNNFAFENNELIIIDYGNSMWIGDRNEE